MNPKTGIDDKPIYDELIKPEEKKIIWYAPPKKELPDVSAQQRIGTFPTPRAPVKSAIAIIATAPKPKSVKQFIWQPVPKVEIHQDLPAPNLIARAAMAIPAPPPPPIPKPKSRQTGHARREVSAAQYFAAHAEWGCEQGGANQRSAGGDPQAAESFRSAPASQRPARLPDSSANGGCPATRCQYHRSCRGESCVTGWPRRAVVLQGRAAASQWTSGAGQCGRQRQVDIAVVGLHPNDKGQVPDGSRPGQFAQAPTVGEIATGEVKGGIGVPNLTIHDDRKAVPPPHVDAPRKVVLYADRLRSLPVSTLSVPLHPASRTIPASIEGGSRAAMSTPW